MQFAKKLVSILTIFSMIVVGSTVVMTRQTDAAIIDGKADLGDLFTLDRLFSNNSSGRIFNQSRTNLGDLFILDQLFNGVEVAPVAVTPSLGQQLAGRIVIQTEDEGKAWYVSKISNNRIFLNGPNAALQVMKDQSLGINNADFDVVNSGTVENRLVGRFLLKTEDSGKLYYVNPVDETLIKINSTTDAFNVITQTGLGITNSDINKIALET